MAAIVYLSVCILFGRALLNRVFSEPDRYLRERENAIWVLLPAWYGVGTLLVTWAVYCVSWIVSVVLKLESPMLPGNAVVLILAVLFARPWEKTEARGRKLIADGKRFRGEAVFFGILAAVITFFFFYVFYVKDGVLYSGYTVFSDYSPHMSMIRSFSRGNNFPTQYPHFGGQDVKYHFMFQFLTGNLELLGLRLDLAYNLVSILSLLGFLMLLYTLVFRISGRMSAGILAVYFFFFRSSLSFFRFLWEHFRSGDLLAALAENTSFIGYTPNETWGFWNFNVYLNQRHFPFGLLLITFVILVYMDWFEEGLQIGERGIAWLRGILFTKKAWAFRDGATAVFLGLLLGLCTFWNGAAVIGGLLILCGMAFCSTGKLDYLLTAAITVMLSVLESRIFMSGGGIGIRFQWGFLVENPTWIHVAEYLLMMSGVVFLGVPLILCFLKVRERFLAGCFFLPLLFAFTISMTPDIGVNHKYIMMAMLFMGVIWAVFVTGFWKKGVAAKFISVLLVLLLSVTGIYDMVTILRGNAGYQRIGVDLNSGLTEWLSDHVTSRDLVLTPEYSMNEATLSGMMMYCGWPYYAWSAGYDTFYREDLAVRIYTTDSEEELRTLVEQEGITMILFEEGSSIADTPCLENTIAKTYPLAYTMEDGGIRIYETR